MSLVLLTSNTNRAIDPVAADVKDVQQNVFPQEVFAANCVPRGFLVLPTVVRIMARSAKWVVSGSWSAVTDTGMIEGTVRVSSGVTNDYREISIRARAFRLVFLGSPDSGIANITIDGANPSTISGMTMEDGSAAQNTVDLYRAANTHRIFVGYKGLSSGAHTIRVTVSGTKNASSSNFVIYFYGIEYVDNLADDTASAACNRVAVLPYGDRDDLVDPGDTAAISYVGSWITNNDTLALLGRYRATSTAADYFEITFTGTGIVLLFNGDGNGPLLDITLDSVLVGNRWSNQFESLGHYNYPFAILGLASGSHTVRITRSATAEFQGTNQLKFCGFFVVKDDGGSGSYGGLLVSGEARWRKTGIDYVTMAAADASNPRKDLLVVNKGAVFSIVQGTAGATPAEPAEPTDDRVPLAVLTQEKTGILLQRLWTADLGLSSENEDSILRYVHDRRRARVQGEIPVGISTQNLPFLLPAKAKRLRVRKTGATVDRLAVKVFGSSPAIQREFDDVAAVPLDGFMNVEGFGGKVVEILNVLGTGTLTVVSVW